MTVAMRDPRCVHRSGDEDGGQRIVIDRNASGAQTLAVDVTQEARGAVVAASRASRRI
jgi:hypothetical protein